MERAWLFGAAQAADGIWFYPLAPSVFPEGTSLGGQMMRMLKLLGLMVFVACIAAFASGCGGGGGGGTAEEMPPVMECPEGQIGTYPDCMDPPSTDEQRIAAARQTLASIVTNARSMAQTASSAAAQVELHADATVEQIDMAFNHALAAQAALTVIEAAGAAANAATTPAEAELALEQAQAALDDLIAAQSAAASIQSAVETAASQREQMRADVVALTNGSSLIQHVRANKLLSDALLNNLAIGSINVGQAGATTINDDDTETCAATATSPCATFPANTGSGATAVTGQRTVRVGPTGSVLVSNSTTPALTGTSRLPHGFDLDNGTPAADPTLFINAYTDITQTRLKVRTRTNALEDDTSTTDMDERYTENDIADADYLVAGIWLTVDNTALGNSAIQAFAYGSQPIPADTTLCSGLDGPTTPASSTVGTTATTTTTRTCGQTTGFNQIVNFVDDGKDFTATYTGDANGAYIAGGETSYFTGSVSLTAEFINPTGAGPDGRGSIQGAVTNITAGGQQMAGSIELQKRDLGNAISDAFGDGMAVGVVDDKSFSGNWRGQFFGMRYTRTEETESETTGTAPNTTTTTTITTTYSPEAPGSVAGSFFVKQLSNPAGEAAFIGAFGAHR